MKVDRRREGRLHRVVSFVLGLAVVLSFAAAFGAATAAVTRCGADDDTNTNVSQAVRMTMP